MFHASYHNQAHFAMSDLFTITSGQQDGDYARALRKISQVKGIGLEATIYCRYSIGRLHVMRE